MSDYNFIYQRQTKKYNLHLLYEQQGKYKRRQLFPVDI